MESNVYTFLANVQKENDKLRNSLSDMEADNQNLNERIILLEKALEKEKKFHRRYADEVAATETIRIQDFKREKQSIVEENKALTRINRQLNKDVAFYKMAHAELANESLPTTESCNHEPIEPPTMSTSETQTTLRRAAIVHASKRQKDITKINLSLFEENKKLQSKISDMNSRVSALNKKNKQLENFRNKMENKKAKFCTDAVELEQLIDSSKKRNKDTFTAKVLEMLENLAKNKK